MHRVDCRGWRAPKLRVRPAENSLGRDVAVRISIEHQYPIGIGIGGNVDLIIYRIHAHLVICLIRRTLYSRMRSLDDSNGGFFSVRSAAERQDRLCQRTRDADFIMDRIKAKAMHGPADQRLLAFQRPHRSCILSRQPGESRNLRMVHSIRNQNLFPHRVINQGLSFAKSQRCFIFLRAADSAQRSHISIRHERIHGGRRTA
jgi:hypothetical protein